MSLFTRHTPEMPSPAAALPGRAEPIDPGPHHFVSGRQIKGPWPDGIELAVLANGCFWGTEEDFWQQDGVYSTAVGYVAGFTPNPTYEEVCTGMTGHTEAALVAFDPEVISYEELLARFWEHHDPTQGMRQGNDIGTQYRSGIYTTTGQQHALAQQSKERYQEVLRQAGYGDITTEVVAIDPERDFFYAEPHHQQYLAKNPAGYRCHSETGLKYPLVRN